MSIFGSNSFSLLMNYYNQSLSEKPPKSEIEQLDHHHNDLNFTPINDPIIISKDNFTQNMPKTESSQEIHKYILETMRKEDEMDLTEKYIFSIYLSMNIHLLTKEIKKDILEEELHLVLINWLVEEKYFVEEEINEDKNNIYSFSIYIGLLINIISLFEILPIKTSDLSEFKFYKKLFKINKFVKLNINLIINISLSFFINKIENILKKWETKLDCLYLAKNIEKYLKNKNKLFLGKKTKRNIVDKEVDETETDSASDRGESYNEDNKFKLGGLFIKKKRINKKVKFDLEKNKTIFFDKEENVSNLLSFKL